MPSLADISDAGGWAVFAFAVFGIALAGYKRWIVPGWIYDQERDQRAKAEIQAERNSEALAKLADWVNDQRAGHA